MRGGPHRNTAVLEPAILKILGEPNPPTCPALVPMQARIRGGEGRLPLLQPQQFAPRGEDVRREEGHVFERPRQQRRHDGLRDARRLVLPTDEAIAGDLVTRPPRPWLDRERNGREMHAVDVEVEDDFEQVRDDHRAAPPVAQQLGVTVEQALVDAIRIAAAEFDSDELEEASRAVEDLPEVGRRERGPETWKGNVEARVEILPQAARHFRIGYGPKMHRDVASPGVLAEDGGTEIPAGVAVAGEIIAAEPGPQRCGHQHGRVVRDTGRRPRRNGEAHSRASGGR